MSAGGPDGGHQVASSDVAVITVGAVVLVGIALLGGTPGRMFVAAIAVLVLLARWGRSGPPGRSRVRLALLGSLVVAVGAVALWLGRVDLVAFAIVACAVDAAVAYLGTRRVEVAASTARVAVAGDTLEVVLRVRGARDTASVRLLDPLGDAVPVPDDRPVGIAHVAQHRGVYSHIRVEVSTSGWMSTVTARRLLEVPLDAPITVWPRSVTVEVPVRAEAADDVAGAAAARQVGEAPQVRSLRPYTPGDPRRRVHWPTTARRGELSVVEVDADTRASVHLAVVLPGIPCELIHAGSHADHLDEVTGQARHTAEELLAGGVPVVLTTVEVDGDGGTRTVTAALRSRTELGTRLACAAAGVPTLTGSEDAWVLGPDRGAARRRAAWSEHVEDEEAVPEVALPPAADPPPAQRPPCGQMSTDALLDEVEGADHRRHRVLVAVWLPTVLGLFATMLGAEVGWVLVPLLLALVLMSGYALVVGRKLSHPPGWWVLDAVLLGAAAAWLTLRDGDRVELPLALAVVWCLPRLMGLRVLTVGAGRSGHWSTTIATALVAAGLATATLVPRAVIAVVVTVVVAAALLTARVAVMRPAAGATSRVRGPVATVAGRTVVVSALTLLLLPLVAAGVQGSHDRLDGAGSSSGQQGGGPSESWLGERDPLDLTRPRDAAPRIVLTMESDRPALLRDTSYELWDGQVWSPGPSEIGEVLREPEVLALVAAPAASTQRQRITVHANGAERLPAVAEPVEVSSDGYVVALTDGNLRASPPVTRGQVYEVVSEVPRWSDADLRRASAGRVPAEVRERFASPSGLSSRVVDDVRAATEGAATTYDRVRALEGWLGEQVTYSLDAPLPPAGVDVVEHFLYDAREGWCQQIATAMTLMLREIEVPARLVTGFAATEFDGDRYVVRERHAHAWVEVYLPGIGWYELDPTQVVSLAQQQEPPTAPIESDPRLWMAAGVVLVVLLALWGVGRAVTRRRRRNRPGEPADPRPWATAVAQRLEALGSAVARGGRRPDESVVSHARRLAERLGEPRLAQVGRLVERDAYDRLELAAAQRDDVDRLLDEVEEAVASSPAAAAGAFSADAPPRSGGASPAGSSPAVETGRDGGGPPPPPGPDRR